MLSKCGMYAFDASIQFIMVQIILVLRLALPTHAGRWVWCSPNPQKNRQKNIYILEYILLAYYSSDKAMHSSRICTMNSAPEAVD